MLKLQKEYIDVDYTEADNQSQSQNENDNNITINTDPLSALISGAFNSVNNLTNAVKEYNICKQQEQTKRTAIKAQMKIEMEKINMQKDAILAYIENHHEEKMAYINHIYSQTNQLLNSACDAVHSAIKIAQESGDFSQVMDLIDKEANLLKICSEFELKQMELLQSTHSPQIENNIAGFLK